MKRVYVDKNGNIENESPQGIDAWNDTYERMIANGASKEAAKAAANRAQEQMDALCCNGYLVKKA